MADRVAIKAVVNHLRHDARGRERAVRLDDLAQRLGLPRRTVERACHEAACAGHPVGTSCTGLDGSAGPGTSGRGMGAFWIVTRADWEAAFANIERRFRPLAQRRRGLLSCRPRTDGRPVRQARADLAAIRSGERPPARERDGQGLLFRTATGRTLAGPKVRRGTCGRK